METEEIKASQRQMNALFRPHNMSQEAWMAEVWEVRRAMKMDYTDPDGVYHKPCWEGYEPC